MPKVPLPQDHGRVRAANYPDIGDQLDEIWKYVAAVESGEAPPASALEMLERICTVKERFPKRR